MSSLRRRITPHTLLLLLFISVGFALRVAVWWRDGRGNVVYDGDSMEYYLGAVSLLTRGTYYDEGQWLRPPLYSVFLAIPLWLSRWSLSVAMFAQVLVSTLQIGLVYGLARSVLANRRAALWSAALCALFVPYILYASQQYSETLFIALVTAAMWAGERGSGGEKEAVSGVGQVANLSLAGRGQVGNLSYVLLSGILWGLATLTRPVGLYFVPLVGLALIGLGWLRRRQQSARPMLRAAIALLLGYGLVVGPWVVRNTAKYGQLVLVDTNSGVTLWFGTLQNPAERELQGVWNQQYPNSAQRQQAAMAAARANIARDPLGYVGRMKNKVVAVWQLQTRNFADNTQFGLSLLESSFGTALVADLAYLLVVVLAIGGWTMAQRGHRRGLLLAWPLYGTLMSALALGHPRLRLPLLIPAFVYAGYALTWRPRLMPVRWQRVAFATGAMLVFGGIVWSRVYLSLARTTLDVGRGGLAAGRGDWATATNYYQQATTHGAGEAVAFLSLGEAYAAQGAWSEAGRAFGEAATLASHSVLAHAQQVRAATMQGNWTIVAAATEHLSRETTDNNEWYQWAWVNHTLPPPARIDVGDGRDIGFVSGVSGALREGDVAFRWSDGAARLKLMIPVGSATLALRLRAPDAEVNTVTVIVKGEEPHILQLSPSWQTYVVPLHTAGVSEVQLRSNIVTPSITAPQRRGIQIDWVAAVASPSAVEAR